MNLVQTIIPYHANILQMLMWNQWKTLKIPWNFLLLNGCGWTYMILTYVTLLANSFRLTATPRQTQHVGTWFKAIRDRKMVSGNSGKNVIYTILEILVFSFGVTAVEKLEKLRYSNDDLLVLVLDFQTKSQQSWVCARHHSCNRSMAWFVVGMTPSYVGRTQIDIAMWSPPTGPHRSWWSLPSYWLDDKPA